MERHRCSWDARVGAKLHKSRALPDRGRIGEVPTYAPHMKDASVCPQVCGPDALYNSFLPSHPPVQFFDPRRPCDCCVCISCFLIVKAAGEKADACSNNNSGEDHVCGEE